MWTCQSVPGCYSNFVDFSYSPSESTSLMTAQYICSVPIFRFEYTTLVEVEVRIFSTSVDLTYEFAPVKNSAPTDAKKLEFVVPIQKGEEGYTGSEDCNA
jgi:hypothetical protein